jgi:hypothetical protein
MHMSDWKENPIAGRIDFHLLNVQEASFVSFPKKLSRQQVRATLRHVAKHEAPLKKYVKGEIHTPQGSQKVGCLLLGHERTSGDPGYYAAILTEDVFSSCGYVSIVPSDEDGKSIISELSADGWQTLTAAQAGNRASTLVALTALNEVPDSKGRIRMQVDNLIMRPEPTTNYLMTSGR